MGDVEEGGKGRFATEDAADGPLMFESCADDDAEDEEENAASGVLAEDCCADDAVRLRWVRARWVRMRHLLRRMSVFRLAMETFPSQYLETFKVVVGGGSGNMATCMDSPACFEI